MTNRCDRAHDVDAMDIFRNESSDRIDMLLLIIVLYWE